MRAILFAIVRVLLAMKVFSFLWKALQPFVVNDRIVFPEDSRLRTKCSVLVLIAFAVLVYIVVKILLVIWSVLRFLLRLGASAPLPVKDPTPEPSPEPTQPTL